MVHQGEYNYIGNVCVFVPPGGATMTTRELWRPGSTIMTNPPGGKTQGGFGVNKICLIEQIL